MKLFILLFCWIANISFGYTMIMRNNYLERIHNIIMIIFILHLHNIFKYFIVLEPNLAMHSHKQGFFLLMHVYKDFSCILWQKYTGKKTTTQLFGFAIFASADIDVVLHISSIICSLPF